MVRVLWREMGQGKVSCFGSGEQEKNLWRRKCLTRDWSERMSVAHGVWGEPHEVTVAAAEGEACEWR